MREKESSVKFYDLIRSCPSLKIKGIKVVIALGIHLFPFRTEKLSPTTPMVLRKSGRVGSRRFKKREGLVGRLVLLFYVFI